MCNRHCKTTISEEIYYSTQYKHVIYQNEDIILYYCIDLEAGLQCRLTLCPLVQISHQLEVPLQFKRQILYA